MACFALFATTIGACGIAWEGDAVIATHLPERTEAGTAARLLARTPALAANARATPAAAQPRSIRRAIADMTVLLEGAPADLRSISCDLTTVEPFAQRVYGIARDIPPGTTCSYGEIAERLGDKQLARSVGTALGRNPLPIIVPCHRVVGADGKLTGFSAHGGLETKLKMLAIEGAAIGGTPDLFAGR